MISAIEDIQIPTYGLGQPEKNPVFFEKRVYQGSCGKVYPVPFIDKVFQDEPPKPVTYQSARLENEFLRLVMLPEIGGRIFLGQDKGNKDYDFFYRQDVIKPALVGLAGPWMSGGVEFNWPQHHRPGTYLPADVSLEKSDDGSSTVWMSEHDPINRLKGMHGICVKPGSSLIELKGRLFNRTPLTQTFLWWANVAARVHDQYQSFFPSDVHYVADHAVRAMSSFPIANNDYYGVDYAARQGANDLSWYKNIPVPTSYMVCQTGEHFFGGYDHEQQGGFIHVANRHISPGKKQWTWGNHEFGWAWDRELTDENGPYVELMAGVYTDNQPDFSYLLPYETKTFSQYWWPYQKLGPVQQATKELALRCEVEDGGMIDLGVASSSSHEDLRLVIKEGSEILVDTRVTVRPNDPWVHSGEIKLKGDQPSALECVILSSDEQECLLSYRPPKVSELKRERELATEPPLPEDIISSDELYFTAEHLEQYRHPTRYPESYWEEGLRRDPLDARCNIAMGKQKLQRCQFKEAQSHFEKAISRLTCRHPNPESGEAHYYLGLSLRYQNDAESYGAFYKATWNYEWRSSAYYELAALDMKKKQWKMALEHLEASLDTNRLNNKAQVAKAIALRKLSQKDAAKQELLGLLERDSLDHWAKFELNLLLETSLSNDDLSRNDAQTVLDISFDYGDLGCYEEACSLLDHHHSSHVTGVSVPNPMERNTMTHYARAWFLDQGGSAEASTVLAQARDESPDYFFPSRAHEEVVLRWALSQDGKDRNAAYGLGNLYYDRKRHHAAIEMWKASEASDSSFSTNLRNLGIATWNILRDGKGAESYYAKALSSNPEDSRLIAESVQLWDKLGKNAKEQLEFLEDRMELVLERDDATVELVRLYNETHQPQKALKTLTTRSFHPWEGGEGKVLRQYTTARLLLGQDCLERGASTEAVEHFELAMNTPDALGEKYHLLQAKADVSYWQGKGYRAAGDEEKAQASFQSAASESGDFQNMAVTEYSELTVYKALSLHELGKGAEAIELLEAMINHCEEAKKQQAKIDYFATSLPNLLVFEEDIDEVHKKEQDDLIDASREALASLQS